MYYDFTITNEQMQMLFSVSHYAMRRGIVETDDYITDMEGKGKISQDSSLDLMDKIVYLVDTFGSRVGTYESIRNGLIVQKQKVEQRKAEHQKRERLPVVGVDEAELVRLQGMLEAIVAYENKFVFDSPFFEMLLRAIEAVLKNPEDREWLIIESVYPNNARGNIRAFKSLWDVMHAAKPMEGDPIPEEKSKQTDEEAAAQAEQDAAGSASEAELAAKANAEASDQQFDDQHRDDGPQQ